MDAELRPSPQKKVLHAHVFRATGSSCACVCVCVCINVDKFVLLTWVTRDLPQCADPHQLVENAHTLRSQFVG